MIKDFKFSKNGSPFVFPSQVICHVQKKIGIHHHYKKKIPFCYHCLKLISRLNLVQRCNVFIPLCNDGSWYLPMPPIKLAWFSLIGLQLMLLNLLISSFLCSLSLMDLFLDHGWKVHLHWFGKFKVYKHICSCFIFLH